MVDLAQGACEILLAAEPADKVTRALALAADWRQQQAGFLSAGHPPARPARPERPPLLPPRAMPKRKAGGSLEKRIALLHALAPYGETLILPALVAVLLLALGLAG